jgi:cation transport regulator ChaC
VCWGVAFKIPGTDVETTRAYLDHREKVNQSVKQDMASMGMELTLVW